MPQNIAAKKAWIKIYRRKGQHAKADKLEKELKEQQKSRMLSRPQMQGELVKRAFQGRVRIYDKKYSTYVYAKPGDPAITNPSQRNIDRVRKENSRVEKQIRESLWGKDVDKKHGIGQDGYYRWKK